MTTPNDLPLSLYKANTELQLRVNKLVMEHWKKWLELSTKSVGDGIAESQARIEQLIKAQDWAALSTLPGETFWQQLQQRAGEANITNQVAANVQTQFAQGLQEAIQVWQKDTARALGGAGDAGLMGSWEDAMAKWGRFGSLT
ncbi:phasin family protein [Dyella sp. 20L07]|uniref:phasin family protein n=1 Tax=Dyella sp. 20L07 TaxID=3384240 RepID=UPI003D28905C